MAAFSGSNDYLTGRKPMPFPSGSEHVSVRFPLVMTTTDEAINTIGPVGILPAGCVPIEVRVSSTDIDTSTAAVIFQIGIGNAALTDAAGTVSTDVKNTLVSTKAADGGGIWGITAASTAAFDQSLTRTANNMVSVLPATTDRDIVMKVQTAPSLARMPTMRRLW